MPIILVGESLAEIERHLDALKKMESLKAGAPAPAATRTTAPDTQASLNRKMQRLKQRASGTTGKVWELVVAASKLPPGQEFSLADLAKSMGEKASRVRSWHRILGRPTKRLKLSVFEKSEGSDRPTRFTMSAEVRKAVAAAEKPGGTAGQPRRGKKRPAKSPSPAS